MPTRARLGRRQPFAPKVQSGQWVILYGVAPSPPTSVTQLSAYGGPQLRPQLRTSENINVTPSTLAIITTIQEPTIYGTCDITVSTLAGEFSVKSSTEIGDCNLSPSVLSCEFSVIVYTISGSANVTPDVLTYVAGLLAPTIVAGGDITVAPDVLSTIFSIQSQAISGDYNFVPSVLTAAFSATSPSSITGTANVTASVINAAFSTKSPSISGDSNLTSSVLGISAGLQPPNVSGYGNVSVGVLSSVFTINDPAIAGDSSVLASVLVGYFTANEVSFVPPTIVNVGVLTSDFLLRIPIVCPLVEGAYDIVTRLDHLGERMKDLNQACISYQRGASSVSICNPTMGKTDTLELAAFGVTLLSENQQDYIFDLVDLASFDPPWPKVGDRILDGSLIFEVFSVGNQSYHFTVSSRKRVRVHTKQVPT